MPGHIFWPDWMANDGGPQASFIHVNQKSYTSLRIPVQLEPNVLG